MSTAEEIIVLTRNLLNDNVNYSTSASGVDSAQSFGATMYMDAVNFACKQYALRTNATYIEASITSATATSTIAVPADILNPLRVMSGNKILVPSSYEFESLKNPQWSAITVSSTVTKSDRWIRLNNNQVRLVPADYNAAAYKLCYTQMPTIMTANASTVDSRIYTQHQDYLKFAAGAYLLQFRGDEQSLRLAGQYMGIFESLVVSAGVVK
jgi:hypothetical protein